MNFKHKNKSHMPYNFYKKFKDSDNSTAFPIILLPEVLSKYQQVKYCA